MQAVFTQMMHQSTNSTQDKPWLPWGNYLGSLQITSWEVKLSLSVPRATNTLQGRNWVN